MVAISFFNNYLFQYKRLRPSLLLEMGVSKHPLRLEHSERGGPGRTAAPPSGGMSSADYLHVTDPLINTWQFQTNKQTNEQTNKQSTKSIKSCKDPQPGANRKLGGQLFKIRVSTRTRRNAEKNQMLLKAAWQAAKTSRCATEPMGGVGANAAR